MKAWFIVLALLGGCTALPVRMAPTVDYAEAECTGEVYLTWGRVQMGVLVAPVCNEEGCRAVACVDVAGFLYCDSAGVDAPESVP